MCLAIHSNPEVQNILPHLIRDYIFLSLFFDWIFNFWKFHSIFAFQNLCFTYLSIRNILLSRKLRLALKTLSLKFSFSVFLFFNISFESEFGNPLFETLEKQNVFNFQLRGHSTTTWTEFFHFLTPHPPAWTVFIPWAWTKTDIFWPPAPSALILST